MTRLVSMLRLALVLGALLMVAAPAAAQFDLPNFASIPEVEPPITNWMTEPVTPIAHEVRRMTFLTSAMVIPFLILPQVLLLIAMLSFRASRGHKPATFHDNLKLEVVWTVIPVAVLVAMAGLSYPVLKKMERMPDADVTVEIIGHRFFWEYRYPDQDIRMSDVPLIIPAGKNVVANITSSDVNHAWWVPAFGIKMDAVPGRTTQLWMNVETPGWYKGQCAELCGALHSHMYIDVWVVTEQEFNDWVASTRTAATAVASTATP